MASSFAHDAAYFVQNKEKKTPKESSSLLTRVRDMIILLLAYLVSDFLQESFWILMAARILDYLLLYHLD